MKLAALSYEGAAACGRPMLPLTACVACGGGCGKGAPGQAAPLRLGGRRRAMGPSPTALRFSVAWPVAKLTALTAFAAFKQAATSQFTSALRARPRVLRCSAPQRRCAAHPGAPLRTRLSYSWQEPTQRFRGRCCPPGAISGATSSAGPGSARASALRGLTRRGCSSAVSAANAASSAARPRTEQRSAVAAGPRRGPAATAPA